ncbi:MAG TPA: ABC transporter permease subunit [Blastocatellia bacterium]|jgi:ABC-2 type transport system permease protein|nr:ABC transporter permease subunit [Blastocatellia bacterium]
MRSALLRIAHKEFIEVSRDGRFRWAFGVIFALLIMSLLMGWRHYAEVRRQIEAAQGEQRELWLNTPGLNPHSAAHHGLYVFKPAPPLSSVDSGIAPYAGVSFLLEAHDQNLSQNKPAEDRLAVARFGETTAAVTLQILVPLLIILLAFSSFAGEREQGTLRHLLSIGVRPKTLAAGKALGAMAPLLLSLIPAAAIGAVAMVLNTAPATFAAALPRAGALALSYLLYFGMFVGLALIVSAKAPTARLALVALLAFWFINCLVAPRVMADVAHHVVAMPSASEFLQAVEEDKKRIPPDWKERVIAGWLSKYRVTREEDLPVNPFGILLVEGEKWETEVYERNFARLFDLYERQNAVYTAGGLLTPMLSIQMFSMGMAGTDFNQSRHFMEAVGRYRTEWLRILNEDVMLHQRPDQVVYTRERDLWEQIPPLVYQPPSARWAFGRQKLSFGILVLWFSVIALATPAALARIRIE